MTPSTIKALDDSDAAAPVHLDPVTSDWPRYEADEIDAACRVLRSGKVNALVHGEETTAFAAEFAAYIGMPWALCLANGTLTLQVALQALGIGPGDEVIVPARSFFATASCVLAVGAMPAFADVLPNTQNIDPASVERLIGARTKAILCVHLAGWPCDMDALVALCDRHGLLLLEDCAQAHGATWRGKRVGSFGAASSFSFCTDKIMSTGGEGGILLLRDREAWEIGWSIKDHGKARAKTVAGPGAPGSFRYLHDIVGSNYRMTELQAAIGRRQLAKLPQWLALRRRNAAILLDAWSDLQQLRLPSPPLEADHSWYKFYVQLDANARTVAADRGALLAALLDRGIPAGTGSCPDMSREQALAPFPVRRDGELASAAALGRRTLMFPVDHTLDLSSMVRIADTVRKVLTR